MALILMMSGFFYWWLRVHLHDHGFSTWVDALDISMAHFAVTYTLIAVLLFLFYPVFKEISYYLLGISLRQWQSHLAYKLLISIVYIILFGGALWFLLVRTSWFQLFFFGEFDPYLGFKYPTTFRFSVLYPHIKGIIHSIAADQILANIIGFLVILTGLLLGISGFFKAIGDITEKFKHK
jgi:hypothetical protein